MKVLFVGGSGVSESPATRARLAAWAEGFRKNGIETYLLCVSPRRPAMPDVFCGIRYVNISRTDSWAALAWRFELAREMVAFCRSLNLGAGDIIWAVEREVISLELSLWMSRWLGAAPIHELTEHPAVMPGFSGKYRRLYIERRYLRSVRLMPVISTAISGYCTRSSEAATVVTGPIVRTGTLEIRAEGSALYSSAPQKVTYAGSLSQAKDGVVSLVECFEKAMGLYLGGPVELDIYGSGTPADLRALKNRVEQSPYAGRIRILGQVDPEILAGALTKSQVLVMPRPRSLQADFGFPTKLAEYLASGVPVVATRVSDVASLVENGVEALIVDPGDVEAFARAMVTLLEDAELSFRIGEAGQRLVLERWNSVSVAKSLLLSMRKVFIDADS